MGRGDNPNAQAILYGSLRLPQSPGNETRDGTLLDQLKNLELPEQMSDRDHYYLDREGFSGAVNWFVKSSKLPIGWWSPNKDLTGKGPELIETVLAEEWPDYFSENSQKLLDCQFSRANDRALTMDNYLNVHIKSDVPRLVVSVQAIAAISQLSGGDGVWKYLGDVWGPIRKMNNRLEHIIVYCHPDDATVLGAALCRDPG